MNAEEVRLHQEVRLPKWFDLSKLSLASPPKVEAIGTKSVAGTTLTTAKVSWVVEEVQIRPDLRAVIRRLERSEILDVGVLEPA